MSNECSIYFERRKIVLTESIESHFNRKLGLFTRYTSPQELSKILDFFQTTTHIQDVFISGKDLQTMMHDFACLFRVIEASGGLVQNDKREFLFIFRNGKWDLPKGKLEPNEKIEDAAIREVSEETGITNIQLKRFISDTYHTYRIGNTTILKKTHWFNMFYNGNEPLVPQQSENITQVKWISKNQVNDLLQNSYDTIREVLEKVGLK
jgi:ADP-ribose pyrophosphatase YjhB (NUDIX family)